MAHIVEFAVSGLAGRTKVYSQKLNRDVNIIFGVNGAGKTTMLRILDSAMSSDASQIVNCPFHKAEVVIHSSHFDKDFVYTYDRHDKGVRSSPSSEQLAPPTNLRIQRYIMTTTFSGEQSPNWNIKPTIPDKELTGWMHTFLTTTRMFGPTLEAQGVIEPHYGGTLNRASTSADEVLGLAFENTMQRLWSTFFGQIQATVRQSQEQGLAEILNEVISTSTIEDSTLPVLQPGVAYERVVSFLHRQHPKVPVPSKQAFLTRFQKSGLLRKVVDRIDKVEQEIAQAMQPRSKLEGLMQRLYSGPKALRFGPTTIDVVTNDNINIGLRSLSSGEKQLLYLLVETMRIGNSSLLIDEPEISMHVDWQRELVSCMRQLNPEAQLILATHSPEIMADIPDTQIFAL